MKKEKKRDLKKAMDKLIENNKEFMAGLPDSIKSNKESAAQFQELLGLAAKPANKKKK